MQNAIINVNGRILNCDHSAEHAKISVFDRGYLYGDSLYEVTRTYNGKFFLLEEHLQRLEQSAALCRMVLGQSTEHYRLEAYRALEEFRKQPGFENREAYCRIIVSRGAGKIGFGLSCLVTPTQYTMILQPVEGPSTAQFQKGHHLRIAERIRNNRKALDPAMKSGNYLNNVLAFLEAASDKKQNFDDALLCNEEGHVTEGTTFNIFYVRRGIIVTPPLEIGILNGITRRHVIKIATQSGFHLREVRFPRERLYEADEAFITSSLKEVFPVTRIDGRMIGTGLPGPITSKLHSEYRKTIPA